MNLEKEKLLEQSLYIPEIIYQGRQEKLFPYLHSQILWTDITHGFCCLGAHNIRKCFSSLNFKKKTISKIQIQAISEVSGIYRVCESYQVYEEKQTKDLEQMERITLLWVQEEKKWKLFQVNLDRLESKQDKVLNLKDVNRSWNCVRLQDIFAIEARGRHCILKSRNEELEVLYSISELEKQVTEDFIRVHRSFLVNLNFIRKLVRFQLELENGEVIPIPEKRFCYVKQCVQRKKTFGKCEHN